jgi:hypothetical protein
MSRPIGMKLSNEHKQNISKALTGRAKTFIYSKFSYEDYMEIYNDFIKLYTQNNTIGIEQYCKSTKKISSTTFRKFIKSNNLYCPKAKWDTNRIETHRKYMIEIRFGLDYDIWTKLQPAKKLYYNLVRSLTEKQPLHLLDNFLKRGKQTFHVDHIIPIIYGYNNNIPADEIAHINNLRIISATENLQKSCNLILE